VIGTSVTIGILFSFVFTEFTGLLAGGLVGPGYLALYLEQPWRVLSTFAAAGAARLIVGALSRRIIIYGRRRFMALILTGMALGWILERFIFWLPPLGQDFRAIGYIIPGLIANDAFKQGFLKTCAATLIVAGLIRLALIIVL